MEILITAAFVPLAAALGQGCRAFFERRFMLRTVLASPEGDSQEAAPSLPEQETRIAGQEGIVQPISGSNQPPEKTPLKEPTEGVSRVTSWLANEYAHMLAILNQLRVGVVITNGEGCIIFISKAAEHLFDRGQTEALGRSWKDVLPFEDSTRKRLEELLNLSSLERTGLAVQWHSEMRRRTWMEIEIADDPHDPSNRIFYFYDVSEVADLRAQLKETVRFQGLQGQSRVMQAVFREIQVVAPGDATVLIEGETGTGKELVARAIHCTSARQGKPFLAINCAGLSESLLGSQLFGHKRGAFTGAIADQVGLFEAAHGGTLFLDEIGDIPLPIQSSLLRVLEEKEIMRLGETRPRKVDVRIVAATHRDLGQEVAQGRFRQDLFYRICVARITLPPLRDRLEDMPILVDEILKESCAALNLPQPVMAADTMAVLKACRWPGNVRELKSAIESAVIHSDGRIIQPLDLPPEIIRPAYKMNPQGSNDERELILSALRRADGNRSNAARLLGISRATLYRAMTRLNLLPR